MYGITFGVRSLSLYLQSILKSRGVRFEFDVQIKHIKTLENGRIQSLVDQKGISWVAKHYCFCTGAYHGGLFQTLFEEKDISAPSMIAGMRGYWVVLEPKNGDTISVENIILGMGGKPNKVHGKKSLAESLNLVSSEARAHALNVFERCGVDLTKLHSICPTMDFNIMPIYAPDGPKIGVGSGYTFVGIGKCEDGQIMFKEDFNACIFTQELMKLWLFALYGEKNIQKTKISAPEKSCTRSWTWDDHDVFPSLKTEADGFVTFAGGGNTGSTTKCHVEALRALEIIQGGVSQGQTKTYKMDQKMTPDEWEQLQRPLQFQKIKF
ncbi:MAG: hypothetical protein K1X29_10710 [Bdellovibrionales bacterium]|nr:hypothetical protein [Bdellovibrionales bacterium]